MSSFDGFGWDDTTTSPVAQDYDLYAAPAPPPGPAATSALPVTAEPPAEQNEGGWRWHILRAAAPGMLPLLVTPLVFLVLRTAATPLLGLTVLPQSWLLGAVAVMIVVGYLLARFVGPGAAALGVLVAVLAAIAETLLLVAPVAILSAGVAVRLLRAR